jgi:hypothetical protein
LKPKSFRASFQSTVSRRRMGVSARHGGSQGSFVGVDESVEDHEGPPPERSKGDKSRFGSDDDEIHHDNSSSSVLTQQHPPRGANGSYRSAFT